MTPPKKIYGLIGYPVKHSFSPAMHNAAFKALGIDAEYRLFEVKPEELEDFLLNLDTIVKDTKGNSIRAGDVVGFNITLPHKVRAKEILEKKFSTTAIEQATNRSLYYVQLTGAVNTVKREEGRLLYRNTDAGGFYRSLREDLKFNPEGKSILVIGCGGAGRAVFVALDNADVQVRRVFVHDVDSEARISAQKYLFSRVRSLYSAAFISQEEIPKFIKECDLLVNASPVGMKEGDGSVIDKKFLHEGLFVYDVVYNRDTELIKEAKAKGLPAVGGLGMLLYQGVAAFELWTGRPAPVEVMRKALVSEIKGGKI